MEGISDYLKVWSHITLIQKKAVFDCRSWSLTEKKITIKHGCQLGQAERSKAKRIIN